MSVAEQDYQALRNQEALNEKVCSIPFQERVEGFSSDDDDYAASAEALNKTKRDGTPRRSPPKAGEHSTVDARKPRRPWTRFCALLLPSKRGCALICVILAVVLGAAIGGGAWVYKSAPKDGLSPPWYPAPPGGTVKSWEQSYEKARQMVANMSLVEKVNITTGTGYVIRLIVECASLMFPQMVNEHVRRQYWHCRFCRLSQSLSTGRTSWYSLHGSCHLFSCRHHSRSHMVPRAHACPWSSPRKGSETERD